MSFCIFIVWDDPKIQAIGSLNHGVGVQGWFLIPHHLLENGKPTFSLSLVTVGTSLWERTQLILPNCFVVGVLLCFVRLSIYSPYMHINFQMDMVLIYIYIYILFLKLSFVLIWRRGTITVLKGSKTTLRLLKTSPSSSFLSPFFFTF